MDEEALDDYLFYTKVDDSDIPDEIDGMDFSEDDFFDSELVQEDIFDMSAEELLELPDEIDMELDLLEEDLRALEFKE